MNRSTSKVPRLLRWRTLRWVACSAVIPALWACNSRRLAIPEPAPAVVDTRLFKQTVNHKLDILFMVDDSSSMNPLQTKMQAQLPAFMDALVDDSTKQLPDLHVAVVSSSYGGGAWSNVNQCHSRQSDANTLGDDQGHFLQGAIGPNPSPCTMLHPDAKFLSNGDGTAGNPPNFDGTIGDAFKCIALLGDQGCGFESQFESVYYGLYYGSLALGPSDATHDPNNGGFLRPDAVLAIVMVTNEDDCSVRGDSLLLNPGVNSVNDPTGLGALQSYRCNEFGHLCGGQPPPHMAPGTIQTLDDCVSAEDMGKTDPLVKDPNGQGDPTNGHLWPTVEEFTAHVKSFKNNPDDILVAAIAGPTEDAMGNSLYRVKGEANSAAGNEIDPIIDHSCTQTTSDSTKPEYADPAVRIQQWVTNFGANGAFYPICANDFKAAMVGIATKIHAKLGASCISTHVATKPDDPTKHNCIVSQKITSNNQVTTVTLDECEQGNMNAPCYVLTPNSTQCTDPNAKTLFKVCNDAACTAMQGSTEKKDANISCAVE